MVNRAVTSCALLICALLVGGCHSGGVVPDGWVEAAAAVEAIDDADAAKLQVIICYGRLLSNHTNMRMQTPDRPALFWDPGGYYGTNPTLAHVRGVERHKDLITARPPTLEDYWYHRHAYHDETVMEVFEWDIRPQIGQRLRSVLEQGTDDSHPAGRFDNDYPGWFCCIAVSDFLRRFGQDVTPVDQKYFMPQDFAQYLWKQQPDRVHIFRRKDMSHRVYVRAR